MSQDPALQPFDLGDLPDAAGRAEAFWHLTALSYVYALGVGYLTLQEPPDHKAAYNLERSADFLERSIRRAYPEGEAAFLIALAAKKAREGVENQRRIQEAAAAAEELVAAGGAA